jgi:galactose mutarotase-like enzyme
MRFQQRSFDQDGHRCTELVDQTSGFRILVDHAGAELVSVARSGPDGTRHGYLYRDGDLSVPSDGWKNHSTVMGFYIHRLVGERSLYQGEEIRGGNHSFLRTKQFSDPEILLNDHSATMRFHLPSDRIEKSEYPRKVDFSLDYRLVDDCLEVRFSFKNLEKDRPAHLSFGLHPGFAVSSIENARVLLPKGTYRRHIAPGNFLSGETVDFTSAGGPMSFKPFELPGSFLIEPLDWEESVVRLHDYGTNREIQLDLAETPFFTIWSDLHPFICVEPCWGLPDHHEQEPFEQKTGIQVVPHQDVFTRRCSFRFR